MLPLSFVKTIEIPIFRTSQNFNFFIDQDKENLAHFGLFLYSKINTHSENIRKHNDQL